MGSTTKQFLEFLRDDQKTEAKHLIGGAEDEINGLGRLGGQLTSDQQNIIREIQQIIQLLRAGGGDKSAAVRAKAVEVKFGQHGINEIIQKRFTNVVVKDQRYNEATETPKDRNPVYNTDRVVQNKYGTNRDQEMMKKSKRGSQAMRHNNADIADLSDINRPTKIAERFSELYDNEWTEAFECLSSMRMEDRDIIQFLLDVVMGAYKFCKEEAENQIHEVHSAFVNRLQFGSVQGQTQRVPTDPTLLIQYRKDLAKLAVDRLCKEYVETRLGDLLHAKLGRSTSDINRIMADYGRKAVELSWWMCVQDPAVYMCPPSFERFDPNLYRPYTKSGATPHFFVWPALRVKHDGAVLVKGVVQYR